MWLLYCIFGIHFYLFTSADNQLQPAITYITGDMIKNVGESVELKCSVQDAQPGELSWMRDNLKHDYSLLISIGTTVFADAVDHYYLCYNKANSAYTLKIRDLKEEDAGIYKCKITNSVISIQAETNLKIIKPPVISKNSSSQSEPTITYITRDMIKNVGESVELICSVKNAQPGELSWVRDSFKYTHSLLISVVTTVLASDTDHYYISYNNANSVYTLKIRDLKEEDAGIYKCKITNSHFSIQAETNLQIIKQPVISENSSSESEPTATYITPDMIRL